jgi:hypothetical protein
LSADNSSTTIIRPLPQLPHPNPDVLSRQVGNDLVLVHLKTNEIYALSETGARLWESLSRGIAREEVEERLLEEFDVTPAAVRTEVDKLLSELRYHNLIGDP